MLITDGTVMPMDGPAIPDGFVRFENGKITAVGRAKDAPEDHETVSAGGGCILPGFVDAHSHIGLVPDSESGGDINEGNGGIHPELRAADAVDPEDSYFRDARRGGVTTVLVSPGSANLIGGQIAAVKTGGRTDRRILRSPCALKMALGENPVGKSGPETRMAAVELIRRALSEAEEGGMWQSGKEPDPKTEALRQVLEGQMPVHVHAHRASDIVTAVKLAREFGVEIVLLHGTEADRVSDFLREADVPVITGPCLTDRSKPEMRELAPELPEKLRSAGIRVAICTDHPETPEPFLILCAGVAVRGGMSEEEALKSITLRAAEITGIADRVGSLTPGKDADVAVWSGNPFLFTSRVTDLFIDGKRVEL